MLYLRYYGPLNCQATLLKNLDKRKLISSPNLHNLQLFPLQLGSSFQIFPPFHLDDLQVHLLLEKFYFPIFYYISLLA